MDKCQQTASPWHVDWASLNLLKEFCIRSDVMWATMTSETDTDRLDRATAKHQSQQVYEWISENLLAKLVSGPDPKLVRVERVHNQSIARVVIEFLAIFPLAWWLAKLQTEAAEIIAEDNLWWGCHVESPPSDFTRSADDIVNSFALQIRAN